MRKVSSTNYLNQQKIESLCDAAFTLSVISGRWKLTILVKLVSGEKKFSMLKELIPDITERILALQLKSLEQSGLILKTIHNEAGKKTSLFSLTTKGLSLLPVIENLASWGAVNNPNNAGQVILGK